LHAARFNWGLTVKSKAERVLKLLERGPFLEEERERARKIAREIKGFGSFNLSSAVAQPSPGDCGIRGVDVADSLHGRSNSKYEERWRREDDEDKENLIARPEPRPVDAEEPHHRHPFHDFGHRSEAMLLLGQ
jgi:epsin